jgi:histidine triad (HIT) family protein
MENCVFCKIISGEFSSRKIYEDEFTLAFLDISKDVDGHILVVPKKHVKNILDCDSETLSRVFDTVKKVSNHLVENCGYDGVNLLNANDESAGQTVFHLHIHIIPRKNGDELDCYPKLPGAKFELDEMLEKLKMM